MLREKSREEVKNAVTGSNQNPFTRKLSLDA